jgi:hypothetical protein
MNEELATAARLHAQVVRELENVLVHSIGPVLALIDAGEDGDALRDDASAINQAIANAYELAFYFDPLRDHKARARAVRDDLARDGRLTEGDDWIASQADADYVPLNE